MKGLKKKARRKCSGSTDGRPPISLNKYLSLFSGTHFQGHEAVLIKAVAENKIKNARHKLKSKSRSVM